MKHSAIIILIMVTLFVTTIGAADKFILNTSSTAQIEVDLSLLSMPVTSRYIRFNIPVKLYALHEDVLEVGIYASVVGNGTEKIGTALTTLPVPQNRIIEQDVTLDVYEMEGKDFADKTKWYVTFWLYLKAAPDAGRNMTQTPTSSTSNALIAKESSPFADYVEGVF